MKRWFAYGGIAASVMLIAFGIGAIAIGATGLNTVRDEISAQNITATDDAAELTDGQLQPGEAIKTGAQARAFADIMEHHTLESTEGKRYAEMGRFLKAGRHRHQRRGARGQGPRRASRRERAPQPVGDRDGTDDGTQHVVLRRARGDVLDRDGDRPAPDGDRLPRPHPRRRARVRPRALAHQADQHDSVGRHLAPRAAKAARGGPHGPPLACPAHVVIEHEARRARRSRLLAVCRITRAGDLPVGRLRRSNTERSCSSVRRRRSRRPLNSRTGWGGLLGALSVVRGG